MSNATPPPRIITTLTKNTQQGSSRVMEYNNNTHHVLISLGKTGLSILEKIEQILYTSSNSDEPGHYETFLLLQEDAIDKKTSIDFIPHTHRFIYHFNDDSDILDKLSSSLKKIANEQLLSDSHINNQSLPKLNTTRQYFALYFREKYLSALLGQFDSLIDTDIGLCLHITIDLSEISYSAVAIELIKHLSQQYPQALITVYAIYPDQESHFRNDLDLAGTYAILLELNKLRELNKNIFHTIFSPNFKTHGNHAINKVLNDCAYLLFHTISSPLKTDQYIDSIQEDSLGHFYYMRDFLLKIDWQFSNSILLRYLATQVFSSFIYSQASPTQTLVSRTRPSYAKLVTHLLQDKEWLLHPDYLYKNIPLPNEGEEISPEEESTDDIGYHKINDRTITWTTLKNEWSLIRIACIEALGKTSGWLKQYEFIKNYFTEANDTSFRHCGVDTFYKISDEELQDRAILLSNKISEFMLKNWGVANYTLTDLCTFIDEIKKSLNIHLLVAKKRNDEKKQQYLSHKRQLEELYAEWESVGIFARKKIEASFSAELISFTFQNMYTAKCLHLGAQYAVRLLTSIISILDDIRAHIVQHIIFFDTKINAMRDRNDGEGINISDQNTLQLPIPEDLCNNLPPSFTEPLTEIQMDMHDYIIAKLNGHYDISGILKSIAGNDDFYDRTTDLLLVKHPYFTEPKSMEEIRNKIFWQALISLFNQNLPPYLAILNNLMSDALHDIAPYVNECQVPVKNVLLIPPFSSVDTNLYNYLQDIRDQLHDWIPNSVFYFNIPMNTLQIVFRQVRTLKLTDLPYFNQLQNQYYECLQSKNGAFYSMLLHTDAPRAFIDYEKAILHNLDPDEIRYYLLLAELRGVLIPPSSNDTHFYLRTKYMNISLGESMPQIFNNITPYYFKLLQGAVDNAPAIEYKEDHIGILHKRLNNIQKEYLGNKDISHATWQEAGRYMPWIRMSEYILQQSNKEQAVG